MHLHNRVIALAAIVLAIVGLTACSSSSSKPAAATATATATVTMVVTSPAPSQTTTPTPATCPFKVQKNGTCQALVTITSVSYLPGGVSVNFDVKNLTSKPLTNVIVDAEAFTAINYRHKTGQTSVFHQNIPVGTKSYSIKVPVRGRSSVMTASIFGAANANGVFGSGKSNFARSSG